MPSGVTISFEPSVIPAGGSSLQRIVAGATADTGNYAITVTGSTESGGSITRTFQLRVNRPINSPPRVFLQGDVDFIQVLNGTYLEPGYTAADEEDGDLTPLVQVSGTVNMDSVGIYPLTYTVTDSEGLTDQVVRKVNVRNSLNFLNGNYDVITENLSDNTSFNWQTTISASVNTNNRFMIFKISDCFPANPDLDYNPQSGVVTLLPQTFTCITATDTLAHTFSGSGTLTLGTNPVIELNYSDSWLDPISGNQITIPKRDTYEFKN